MTDDRDQVARETEALEIPEHHPGRPSGDVLSGLSAADYSAIATATYTALGVTLPDGTGDIRGRALAEICRAYLKCWK